jgi:hypothetical protein
MHLYLTMLIMLDTSTPSIAQLWIWPLFLQFSAVVWQISKLGSVLVRIARNHSYWVLIWFLMTILLHFWKACFSLICIIFHCHRQLYFFFPLRNETWSMWVLVLLEQCFMSMCSYSTFYIYSDILFQTIRTMYTGSVKRGDFVKNLKEYRKSKQNDLLTCNFFFNFSSNVTYIQLYFVNNKHLFIFLHS